MFRNFVDNESVRLVFFILLFSVPIAVFLVLYNPKDNTEKLSENQHISNTSRKTESEAKSQRGKLILEKGSHNNEHGQPEGIIVENNKNLKSGDTQIRKDVDSHGTHSNGAMAVGQSDNLTDLQKDTMQKREQKKQELDKRLLDGSKRERMLARALVDIANGEIDLMLSIFNTMTPEQKKSARAEALKKFPREDVDDFFNDLSNTSEKTSDQIKSDARNILSSLKTYRIAQRELDIEHNELLTEMSQFYNYDFFNIPSDQQ